MKCSVVRLFLFHGWLVTAFPTNDGTDKILVPVTGVAEFSGTSPATGSVALTGQASCPEVQLPSISENSILGATLADAIIAEAGHNIDAKLAEIDAFVEKELLSMGPQLKNALHNAIPSDKDSSLDSIIKNMESQVSTELSQFDAFIESELAKTEELVQAALRKAESEAKHVTDNEIADTVNKKISEQEALVELVMLILQSFVESKLKETESIVKSELQKVNAFVEKELEKVGDIVKSESTKVDSAVEAELANTDACVQSEVSKMESLLESELGKSESLVKSQLEKVNKFVESELKKTDALVNSEVSKMESLVEKEIGKVKEAVEGIGDACSVCGNCIPVIGETSIIGNSGCPPVLPTSEPIPIYLESFPVLDNPDCEDSYAPMLSTINTGFAPPSVGTAQPFIALNQDPSNSQLYGCNAQIAEPVLYHRQRLPVVDIITGTARASGKINLFAKFPCPPLVAKEIGPDGKKYIWIKKSEDKEEPSTPKPVSPESSEVKNEDFRSSEESNEELGDPRPVTDEDSDIDEGPIPKPGENSNGECDIEFGDLINGENSSRECDIDFVLPGPIPVSGKAVFEGTTPAYGSVSITGHSN